MIVNYKDFNEWELRKIPPQKRKAGNPGSRRKKFEYKDVLTAFDIETTRLTDVEQSILYIWQWQIGEYTVIGRTWEDFKAFIDQIRPHMGKQKLLVFVHNLSYEFQFLSGIYDFMPEEVFAIDSRKILKCEMYGFLEFRCSYLHSNMSLDEYTRKMGVQHAKLSGTFDYTKLRYPWTELSPDELAYCTNDVLGLVEAIKREMEIDGDNFYTFPLTSTGYVRRDAKRAMQKVSHTFVPSIVPNYEIYQMCREAFRGGNTHANRFYSGKVVPDVKSADRSSSYPDVQVNCEFPVSEFFKMPSCTYDELIRLITKRHKAVLMRVAIYQPRLTCWWWGCPYLSRDKCRMIKNPEYDNGRILKADYLETTLTDIDLQIVLSEYSFDDIVPLDVAYARYGKLPQPLIDVTIDYYRLKTTLKGVKGQEIYYTKAKNKLNSIYGMMAQDPVKDTIEYYNHAFDPKGEDPESILERTNMRAFLSYPWGCWVTAWARLRLEEGVRLAGDGFIYCDTDSVKYVGEVDWTAYNEERRADSEKNGAVATDPQGVTHYMGVYEEEETCSEFATLGAKKYCAVIDGKLKVTIAGVTKKKGGPELEKYGGIRAFQPGFVFKEAGGTEALYNDFPEISEYHVDGHVIPITSNVVIRDSTYTLGITAEYMRLLQKSTLEI